jgi:hypothetical protein
VVHTNNYVVKRMEIRGIQHAKYIHRLVLVCTIAILNFHVYNIAEWVKLL